MGRPVCGLDGDEADFGIGRAGWFEQVRIACPRIHEHAVLSAERVRQRSTGLHLPPAVEDLVGLPGGAPAHPRRFEVAQGAAHSIGDALRQEALVFVERSIEGEWIRTAPAGTGVGVGGCHQEVLRRQSRLFVHQPLGLVEDLARDSDAVTQHDSEAGLSVVEHQAAGMQLVVDLGGGRRLPAAHDRSAQKRRDVTGRRAGAERAGLRRTGNRARIG